MDEEFPTSPSKRRRTESPVESKMDTVPTSIPGLSLSGPVTDDGQVDNPTSETNGESEAKGDTEAVGKESQEKEKESDKEPDLLNMLMMQVEAQAKDQGQSSEVEAGKDETTNGDQLHDPQPQIHVVEQSSTDPSPTTDGVIPPPEEREWESDSSPYSSSTDSSSDSDSDDSDDEDDNDYALLSPTEQARMLMDEAGSDDEGGKSKGAAGVVKTANEKVEEVIPKPDVVVTQEMRVEELGVVEAIVENTVLVKAKVTGEYQVLESGSLLCLKDRTVVGVVADTMGRVEQPLYTVRFTNDEAIAEAGVADKGTAIYYVHDHSTFVFTQPLKGIKGSDASNFHDEEVGDEEMEFSDDEKEAEHRRILKLRKRGIDVSDMGGRGGRGGVQGRGGRGGARGRGRGGFQPALHMHPENAVPAAGEALSLNYDDGEIPEHEQMKGPSTMGIQGGSPHQPEQMQQQQGYQPTRFQQHDSRRGGNGRGRVFRQRPRGNRGNYQQQQPPQPYGQPQQQQHQPQSWMPSVPPPPGMPNFFGQNMTPTNPAFNFNVHQQGAGVYGQQQHVGYGHQQVYQQGDQQGYQQPNGYPQQQQQQNGYGQQQAIFPQQHQPYLGGAWANNQAAAEQVQRQLDELRRQQGSQ